MRNGVGAVALAAAAVLAAGPGTTLAAGPGTTSSVTSAAKTWTVHPGGAITATAGQTTLTDTKTGASASCASSSMSGTLRPGSGLPGAGIGMITAAAFHCRPTPIGYYKLMPRGLPWRLNLSSFDQGTGTSSGTISHVQLAFSLFGTPCSAVINGTSGTAADGVVAITYSNHGATLKTLPGGNDLHWYHVQGCEGVVANGDPATLSAVFVISPAQTISSP
jgi:hypothetical protein